MQFRGWVTPLLVVGVLLSTACGARLTEEQQAELDSRVFGLPSGVVAGEDVSSPSGAVATAPSSSATSDDDAAGSGTATGGTVGSSGSASGGTSGAGVATGSGDAGTTSGGSGDCLGESRGIDSVGVADDRILLGNVSLLSGPIQGFANTAVGATRAFVAYQNSRGGVCGRQLVLEVADDRFDSGTNRSEYARLEQEVLAFVGSLSVFDDGGVSVLRDSDVSEAGLPLADEKVALPNSFSTSPFDPSTLGLGAEFWARDIKEREGISEFALMWYAQATSRNRANDYRADYEAAGLTSVYESEIPVTETNYTPHAAAVCGETPEAMLMSTTIEVNGMARLMKAIRQQGCLPKVAMVGQQAYGQQFIDIAGDAAEGTRIVLQQDIVEGSTTPMTKEFESWYRRVNPDLPIDFFAVQAWSATHMMITALQNAGPDLTRARIRQELEALDGFDAGGMIVPIHPLERRNDDCYLMATVRDGAWVREYPAQGFRCL